MVQVEDLQIAHLVTDEKVIVSYHFVGLRLEDVAVKVLESAADAGQEALSLGLSFPLQLCSVVRVHMHGHGMELVRGSNVGSILGCPIKKPLSPPEKNHS